LADRVVDHVWRLLGQHVPGMTNMHMRRPTDTRSQIGGV
jgi:hypothetical protein